MQEATLKLGSGRSVNTGIGNKATYLDQATKRVLVEVDPAYFRPTEVDKLLGDPTKAREKLGWEAATPFDNLVSEMVVSDMAAVRDETARKNRHD